MRARRITLPYSDSGMKVFSSGVSRPVQWSRTLRKILGDGLEAEEVQDQAGDVRRAGHGDFRVAADDDRVAVVAGVAPAPDGGLRA